MDLLRRKRHSSSALSVDGVTASETPPTGSSARTSSPASSSHENKGDFFNSIVPRAIRSISRGSTPQSLHGHQTSGTPRKLLKSHTRVSSYESVQRRGSVTSEEYGHISRASTSVSLSSSNSIDWRAQHVERAGVLEADPQHLRSKPAFMVVTQDFVIKFKSKADAVAAFPQLGPRPGRESVGPPPDPVLVIPLHMVLTVYHAESSRPAFGLDVWWMSSFPSVSSCNAQFFFSDPREREEHMRCILVQAKARCAEYRNASHVPLEVETRVKLVFDKEDPSYRGSKPEIFPVVVRKPRDDAASKAAEKAKKAQDCFSWYLAVCGNLCLFVEVARGSELQGAMDMKHQIFGLAALEYFRASWTTHEERFVVSFRVPFTQAVSLKLASRFYRQIAVTFLKADKMLKPCWPHLWQSLEIFDIKGLPEQQFIVPREDYGGLKRTLDAYLAAYRVPAVEWEINWKTVCAPEFRLLPPRAGPYSGLQLLAVLRALRYNDYFNSISLRDIDLAALWNKFDVAGRVVAPYLNRSCVALDEMHSEAVRAASVLHQEVHALAFCSEHIRQLDFKNCSPGSASRTARPAGQATAGQELLSPVLTLLQTKRTKCNRVLIGGNPLEGPDLKELLVTLTQEGVDIQALDISRCRLIDSDLRDVFWALLQQGRSLQALDVSGNLGRIHATTVRDLSQALVGLRKLNVSGILMGGVDGSLIPPETLAQYEGLEELDLSGYNVNEDTILALAGYLHQRPQAPDMHAAPPRCCRLVLNNCGVTGRQAAQLVRATAEHGNVHLYLNGNPIAYGIDELIHAVALTRGPTGLHLDMIEFDEESDYVGLVKALTTNKGISFLSLVGTAPTPSPNQPCSEETCLALEQFFARNRSVRFLDLSGYSGRLDEGQLGKGFGRSLRGLGQNRTITHLRIRNQNLHDDVGVLGSVVRENAALLMVDCQDNSWNLTSLQFLVQSLRANQTILDFPLGAEERDRIWRRVAGDMAARRPSQPLGARAAAAHRGREPLLGPTADVLQATLAKSVGELRDCLQRNVMALEARTGRAVDFDDSTETGGEPGWPSLELKGGGGGGGVAHSPGSSASIAAVASAAPPRHRATVKSTSVGLDTSVVAPYRVYHGEAALESPTEGGSPTSETPVTPELVHSGDGATPPDGLGVGVGLGVAKVAPTLDMGEDWKRVFTRFSLGGLDTHEEE